MNWKRSISRGISETLSRVSLSGDFRAGFRVLLYHSVGTRTDVTPSGVYYVTPDLFNRHMSILKELKGISVVGFEDGNGYGDKLEVAVTFDDGFKDNLSEAAPILTKLEIPFTVFVSGKHIKHDAPEYLNEAELKELAALPGAAIGAHGANHLPLAPLDQSEIWHEVYDSKNYLEDLLGNPVLTMSYPFGSLNHVVRDTVEKAGYDRAACRHWGINDAYNDRLLLYRTPIHAEDAERIFIQKLKGFWDWHGRFQRDQKIYE
ncbi:MAG: polysaccharide deacetylase family protein [Syntrophomonas sp.]